MLNINDVLYKYILEKYGSISAFSEYSGIPLIELNAVLIKENISADIRSGVKICKKLNIDVEKLVFDGEIEEMSQPYKKSQGQTISSSSENTDGRTAEKELHNRYMRLSEIEKKEVLDFVNRISERHENI